MTPSEFPLYAKRDATKYEHLREIRDEYGYIVFDSTQYRKLARHLHSYALANGNASHLIQIWIMFRVKRLKDESRRV